MIHILTEWEQNGYHDSYFYVTGYDDAADTVKEYSIGATAYAGGIKYPDNSEVISDPEVLQRALTWLENAIYEAIRTAEHRDVNEPQPAALTRGIELITTRIIRPKKQEPIPAGTVGEVHSHEALGQFYANGYNKPDRTNTRVRLRLPNVSFVWVALSACRLNREPMADDELRKRARELSMHCQFSRACNPRFTWDTHNYAADLIKRCGILDAERATRFIETELLAAA